MKTILFVVGGILMLVGYVLQFLRQVSRTADPYQRLSDKLPPFWVIISLEIVGFCLACISHFCL